MEEEIKNFARFTLYHKVKEESFVKVILAEHFGICFGVRDAIAQAEELAE